MVVQHKCPNCGADMMYNAETGKLSCESCGHEENIENMPKLSPDDIDEVYGDYEDITEDTSFNTYEEDAPTQYQCKNCGAVLITAEETTATTCSFCGAGMILGDRLSGSLAPAKLIPFTISKEEAQNAFKKWCKNGLLLEKDFMNADRIKNITGMYIPFWLFDLNGQGEASATCTKVHRYSRGDYDYTETKYYDVYRKVDLNYLKIPVDASIKMEDGMMDKLEPYDYNNLKEFNTPYLSGYIAEKYDLTDKELFPRVKNRADNYVTSYIHSTINGYTSTNIRHKDIHIRQRRADYTLLPIWMVCYDYKNTEHNFYMNGQTGKIVGKPPLSKKKMALWFSGISAVSFLVLQALSFVIGGGF